ncbi:uncharacterized protein [Malus domestica]|uniref:uncharacterized protein n=1 Tax=Malus domestica TaxID=3750 RepID=UPI0039764DE6
MQREKLRWRQTDRSPQRGIQRRSGERRRRESVRRGGINKERGREAKAATGSVSIAGEGSCLWAARRDERDRVSTGSCPFGQRESGESKGEGSEAETGQLEHEREAAERKEEQTAALLQQKTEEDSDWVRREEKSEQRGSQELTWRSGRRQNEGGQRTGSRNTLALG